MTIQPRRPAARRAASWLAALVTGGLAVAGVSVVVARGGAGSAGAALSEAVGAISGFRVEYWVEDTAGPEPFLATEIMQVRRPSEVLIERREGPPPGEVLLTSTLQDVASTISASPGAKAFATPRSPGLISVVPSAAALEAAAAAGMVHRGSQATLAGERCTRYVYRSADGPLAPPDENSRVESCVTEDGIPLRTAVTLLGRRVRVATAVQVERNPVALPQGLGLAEAEAGQEPITVAGPQEISEGAPPAGVPLIRLRPPHGFRVMRAVTVNRQGSQGGAPTVLRVTAFERGSELVVAEQLLTPGSPPWRQDEGVAGAIGNDPSSRIVYHTYGAEVRLNVGDQFLRVSATRPAAALALARTARPAAQQGR